MSTTSRPSKLRYVQLGLCLTLASATFAVLVPTLGTRERARGLRAKMRPSVGRPS